MFNACRSCSKWSRSADVLIMLAFVLSLWYAPPLHMHNQYGWSRVAAQMMMRRIIWKPILWSWGLISRPLCCHVCRKFHLRPYCRYITGRSYPRYQYHYSYPWGETRACLNRHVRVLTTRWCSYHNADISESF
jgi:hypothetical protein